MLSFAKAVARLFYRVAVRGAENLPATGFLLLPNHVTWVDAIVIQLACPRPVRFIVHAPYYHHPILHPFMKAFGAIPIQPNRPRDAIKVAGERIAKGEIVCIFPEGELSRSGVLLRLKRGYELIAREAKAPVVPVWLDRLWGSIFSYYGGKFFRKIPRQIPYPVLVAFGQPLSADEADVVTVRAKLLELGAQCYEERPILRGHLGMASLRGLKSGQFKTAVVDGMDHSTLSRGMLLAAAIALSRELRRRTGKKRIACVLPTGKAAVIANLAIVLAGKVPVNLNFTAGKSSLESAVRIANLEDAITARAFQKKFPEFPFPANVILLDDVMPMLKTRIMLWRALVLLLPWQLLARLVGVPRTGGHEEAVVLFSSGSVGEPKGVVLSHHNLIGNVTQFALMLNLKKGASFLACLPFFHSFGCTVTLWFPLIDGIRMITYPNPLEAGKNAELIERYDVTLLCSTPTFLRAYLRRAEAKQLAKLELLVSGAEKLPDELKNAFKEKFDLEIMQGYGLTETSPVVSVNLPEPARQPGHSVQPSNRAGSVGKLAPGMAAQIRDPESDALLPLTTAGMLWLRGPNIFEGYLGDEKRTAEVMRDGWFKTGDLARFDEDGFLFIEGRLSRFSKIGGEMVPHETVENKINEVFGITSDQERVFSITAVPDEAKGEQLVLLTTREVDGAELRAKLNAAEIVNLWIPKKVVRIEKIPVLGTGKLDLKACREAALAGSDPGSARDARAVSGDSPKTS